MCFILLVLYIRKLSFKEAKYTVQSDTWVRPAKALLIPRLRGDLCPEPLLSLYVHCCPLWAHPPAQLDHLSQSTTYISHFPSSSPHSPQIQTSPSFNTGSSTTSSRRFSKTQKWRRSPLTVCSASLHFSASFISWVLRYSREAPSNWLQSVESGTWLHKFIPTQNTALHKLSN